MPTPYNFSPLMWPFVISKRYAPSGDYSWHLRNIILQLLLSIIVETSKSSFVNTAHLSCKQIMSESKDNNLDKINAILSVILQDLQKFHQQPLVCHQERWSRSQYLKGAFQFINSETCCHVQFFSSCVLWECSSQNLVVNCWQIVWLFSRV